MSEKAQIKVELFSKTGVNQDIEKFLKEVIRNILKYQKKNDKLSNYADLETILGITRNI